MEIVQWYILFSIGVGLAFSLFHSWKYWNKMEEEMKEIHLEGINKMVTSGHIQKEVYGTRVVYHPLNRKGKDAVDFTEWLENFQKKHRNITRAVMFVISFTTVTIFWPVIVVMELKNTEN